MQTDWLRERKREEADIQTDKEKERKREEEGRQTEIKQISTSREEKEREEWLTGLEKKIQRETERNAIKNWFLSLLAVVLTATSMIIPHPFSNRLSAKLLRCAVETAYILMILRCLQSGWNQTREASLAVTSGWMRCERCSPCCRHPRRDWRLSD